MGIPEQLKKARNKAGLTQEDVEKLTGINKKTISNWENNVSKPDVNSLFTLCKLYKVNPNTIYEWESEPDDLTEYLDELRYRPEMRMLFSVSKKASKEDVEKAVKIIEMLKGDRNDD